MKKTYINPEMQVMNIHTTQMVCASAPISNVPTTDQWSRESDEDFD